MVGRFAFALLLLFVSCIQIDMFIKLNEDGSGWARVEYTILKDIYASSDKDPKFPLNEDKIAEFLSKRKGVKVLGTGSNWSDERYVKVWAEIEFEDISVLSDNMLKYILEDLGDKKEFRIVYRYWGESARPELVRQAVEGWASRVRVEVPTRIASTNGKILSSKVVEWVIPLSEIAGRSGELVLVVSFEKRKKGILDRIKGIFK